MRIFGKVAGSSDYLFIYLVLNFGRLHSQPVTEFGARASRSPLGLSSGSTASVALTTGKRMQR